MTRAVEMADAVSQGFPLPISFETGSSNEDVF